MLCNTTTESHTLFSRPLMFFTTTHNARLPWMLGLHYYLYPITTAVLQGDVLAVFLWLILIDYIMCMAAIHILQTFS